MQQEVEGAPSAGGGSAAEPGPAAAGLRRGRAVTALATLTGNLFLVVGTIFFATLALLFGWLPPRGAWVWWCARVWSRGLLLASGVRLDVRGAHRAAGGPYVFMANHQSLYDIPALIAALPVRASFLAKQELFRIPVFGWALRLGGFVPVDRGHGAHGRGSFQVAVARIAGGTSVLLFPEETRSRDGRLLPFKRGGFLLALKGGVPVVPVGIAGTLAVRTRSETTVRPGRVAVAFGEPIHPPGRSVRDTAAFVGLVRDRIAALAGVAGDTVGAMSERDAGAAEP